MKGTTLKIFLLCLGSLLWVTETAAEPAGDLPSLNVGGLLFGDLYHIPQHHLAEGDGATGAVIRRGYLTFNARFTENGFGRMRFEINQSGEFETYTFETQIKDLYMGWNLGRQKLLAGLTSTPTFDLIESIWGYRFLARTPMDMQGSPSRDTGFNLGGPINASGTFSYRAMLALGLDFGADSSDQSKWMGALTWRPSDKWTFDFYADFQAMKGSRDRSTLQFFAAYQADNFTWGAQYSNQDRQEDPPRELASVFARAPLSEKTTLVGRIDRLIKPSPRGNDIAYIPFDPSAPATLFISGVEFRTTPHFSIMPNVVVNRYGHNDEGVRPTTDIYLRMTLFLNFE